VTLIDEKIGEGEKESLEIIWSCVKEKSELIQVKGTQKFRGIQKITLIEVIKMTFQLRR
jgi:hypothetical protein